MKKKNTCNHIINAALLAHRDTSVYFAITFFWMLADVCYIYILLEIGNNKYVYVYKNNQFLIGEHPR